MLKTHTTVLLNTALEDAPQAVLSGVYVYVFGGSPMIYLMVGLPVIKFGFLLFVRSYLSRSRQTGDSMFTIAWLSRAEPIQLRGLREIDLRNEGIDEVRAQQLAEAMKAADLRSLERLNLGWNMISDAGAEHLARALPSLGSLRSLWLNSNEISDAGAEHLAKALPSLGSLKILGLRGNRLSDDGKEKLRAAARDHPDLDLMLE